MDNKQDPIEYTPPIEQLCKWEENGMRCNQKVEKDGYCLEHLKKIDPEYTVGAATGAGVAGLITSNPVGLVLGVLIGVGLAVYIAGKSK